MMDRYGDGSDSARTHPKFIKQRSSTNITVQSSDAVIFHLDRTNIKASSGAFPGLDNYDRHNRTIHVEEPSSILEIILPFAEKRGTPKLPRDLEFETLAAIAEAVEKYQIFSAMELCRTRLRNTLPSRSLRILSHALKHDYKNLADEAAFCTLSHASLPAAVQYLPPSFIIPWVQYRDAWKKIFDTRTKVVVSSSNNGLRCVPASGSTCTYCACLMIAWFELFQQLDKTTLDFALVTFSRHSDPSDEFIAYLHSRGPTATSTFFASLVSNLSAVGCNCPSQRCWAMITEAKLLREDVEAFPLFTSFVPQPEITKRRT